MCFANTASHYFWKSFYTLKEYPECTELEVNTLKLDLSYIFDIGTFAHTWVMSGALSHV